jgi:hypothetical protein
VSAQPSPSSPDLPHDNLPHDAEATSLPAVPTMPSLPAVPTMPSLPAVPTMPSLPAVPEALRSLPEPLLLLAGAAEATYSVVRYQGHIVAVYTVLAVLLALWLWRGGSAVRLTPAATAVALAATALVTLTVPAFTYLPPGTAGTVRTLFAGAALVAAATQLLPWRHAADAGLLVAVGCYLIATVLLVHGDPAPRIDVWFTLQGAADALVHGGNPYTQVWIGPPGVMQAFTYLPWMAVLLAPGRWLAGDVRWALAAVTVAAALTVRAFGTRPSFGFGNAARAAGGGAAAGMAALLLLLPGTATQVEQAWTEPLLLACLVGAGLALTRDRLLPAAVLLALALASKQHIVLLLPVLAAWPRVGPRRVLIAGGLAGLLTAPFVLADPAAMWHDTISLLVNFPPLKFADTLFIAALNELHWLPPFWLTGALVLATVGSVSWTVHRRNPGVGEALRWCALVLLVANLLNKQAFYNQYWLVLGLLVASWAVPDPPSLRRPADRRAAAAGEQPDRPSATTRPPSPDPAARTARPGTGR